MSSVTLGKLLIFSLPKLPHLWHRSDKNYLSHSWVWGLNELICIQHIEHVWNMLLFLEHLTPEVWTLAPSQNCLERFFFFFFLTANTWTLYSGFLTQKVWREAQLLLFKKSYSGNSGKQPGLETIEKGAEWINEWILIKMIKNSVWAVNGGNSEIAFGRIICKMKLFSLFSNQIFVVSAWKTSKALSIKLLVTIEKKERSTNHIALVGNVIHRELK